MTNNHLLNNPNLHHPTNEFDHPLINKGLGNHHLNGQPYIDSVAAQQPILFANPATSQKRQNSQSYLMANNPSKRTIYNPTVANTIATPSNTYINEPSSIWMNSPNLTNPMARGNFSVNQPPVPQNFAMKKTIIHNLNQKHLIKTPTPSSYNNNEVPSSPNINLSQLNQASKNYIDSDINNSDSPESSQSDPVVNPLTAQIQADAVPSQQVTDSVRSSASSSIQPQLASQSQQQALLQSQQRVISEEEQQLAKKLKDTYKNIVRLEETCQKGCIDINNKLFNNDTRPELSNELWNVYHNNINLLDNYYDFLLCALRPSSVKTGKQIVNVYKIPRRMWVYGIVGFLEVLKNVVNVFIEHEICACFIAHCFSIISSLTDSILDMEGWWAEKLGDLSRMAIALYSSRFIDWKISSEYWYQLSMKTQYGHGKIYYHMSTVQQDNLDALVNIGKSVTCRDPFVPTPQYLRLVVENICNQRNILSSLELPIIDFIKIHKVLLLFDYNENPDFISLVSRYSKNFGVDANGVSFFTNPKNSLPVTSREKMNFWFQKGSSFAISNITHLIGFGDFKNPLARLFELPEALKERKDKKEKKRKSRTPEFNGNDDALSSTSLDTNAFERQSFNMAAYEMIEPQWFESLQFINKGVIELSFRMLHTYMDGPTNSATSHLIVWLYFLVAMGEASSKYPLASGFIQYFVGKFMPWNSLIPYLNGLLEKLSTNPRLFNLYHYYNSSPDILNSYGNFLNYFGANEFLPEVWKCWGTLWFDYINLKGDYSDLESAGIKKDFFDTPTGGSKMNHKFDNERIVRIILLSKYIADNYNFGLIRTETSFKFDVQTARRLESVDNVFGKNLAPFLNDSRFIGLFESVESSNLSEQTELSPKRKDDLWFESLSGAINSMDRDVPGNFRPPHEGLSSVDESDMESHADADSDDFEDDQFYIQSLQKADSSSLLGDLGDRMDSGITCITLDTNMWLKHCGKIYKCVRSGIMKMSVPLTVFQELRSLRRSQDVAISDAATRAVITIRELYSTNEILPLRFDGSEASGLNETTEFENNSNWRSTVDESILNTVTQMDDMGRKLAKGTNQKLNWDNGSRILTRSEAMEFRYCILVSDDRNMRLRARGLGSISFQGKWLFGQVNRIANGRCTD